MKKMWCDRNHPDAVCVGVIAEYCVCGGESWVFGGISEAGGTRAGFLPFAVFGALLIAQLVAISILYNHSFEFECRAKASAAFCGFLSLGVIRAISIFGVLVVFLIARRSVLKQFLQDLRVTPHLGWVAVQVLGFLSVLMPWFFLTDESTRTEFGLASFFWVIGGVLAAGGAAFAIARPQGWWMPLSSAGWPLLAILIVAVLSPEIAAQFQAIWKFDPLTEATFQSAASFLQALGYVVNIETDRKLLGIAQFDVLVGPQCSGVEGFLLITGFLSFYIWLFRSDLKFPGIWLLLPIGLAFSWIFNVVRISTLIMMGHHVSPDLAIDGFHSHAGWLMFTVVAVGLALTAHSISWFRKEASVRSTERGPVPPLADDPYAAMILPFLVFMASALLLSTFTELPGYYYPLRFIAMAAVLAFFWKYLSKLDWTLDPVPLGLGAVGGVLWLLTAPAAGDADTSLTTSLEGLGAIAFIAWVATRVVGTTLLVPIIEELFFRGYIQARIDTGGWVMRVLAFAVSSGLFAVLHDRWLAAFLAGVLFGLMMLRRGRVTDAIIAHMAANGVIAAWAVFTRDWAVI